MQGENNNYSSYYNLDEDEARFKLTEIVVEGLDAFL